MLDTREQEVLDGRRAWPVSQTLFAGVALRELGELAVGWHDTTLNDEVGAFCLVDIAGPHTGVVGEIVMLEPAVASATVIAATPAVPRRAYVYCLGAAALPPGVDVSLTRRAFLSLGLLALESLACSATVIA